MQAQNRILDDLAKLATGAVGAVSGAKGEVETLIKQKIERYVAELDFVPRDEFDAVSEMASRAREQSMELATKIEALEDKIKKLSKK